LKGKKMTEYVVTLRLQVDGGYYANPKDWNWTGILDLAPEESVEVVGCEEQLTLPLE
jgi:hypothetical protein